MYEIEFLNLNDEDDVWEVLCTVDSMEEANEEILFQEEMDRFRGWSFSYRIVDV